MSEESPPQTTTSSNTQPTFVIGPFRITPTHLFAIAAIPFGFGAYTGYHSHLKEAAKEEAKAAAAANNTTTATIKQPKLSPQQFVDGRVLAVRALSLATMMIMGGFVTLGAATFYFCGFQSFDDAFTAFRRWGTNVRQKYNMPIFDEHPDFQATRGMSEGEEWEYIQKTYIQDDDEEEEEQIKIQKGEKEKNDS